MTYIFRVRSSVTRIRWPATARSLLIKTWWKLVEWYQTYSTFFCVFPGDTLSTWKMETKLHSNFHSWCIFLFTPSTLIIIHKKSWINQFARKLTILSTSPGKCGKGSKIWVKAKINLYCPLHTGLKIRWNFAIIYLQPFVRSVHISRYK